ncbi:MAG: hypothetical protein R6V67_08585, partial [Spirochaetia bacterium]
VPVGSVEVKNSSISLNGEDGASLTFSLGHSIGAGMFQYPEAYSEKEDLKGVRVDWSPPEKEDETAAQLSFLNSYQSERIEGSIPFFSIVGESESYLCTTGGNAEIDSEGALNIRFAGDKKEAGESGCFITPYEGDDPLRYWFFADSQTEDSEAYRELFRQWRDNSYEGWGSRYVSEESTWRNGDEGVRTFESIMTAYAAETMRLESSTGLENFSSAMDAYGGRHGFFSSPYLGNIIGNDGDYSGTEESMAENIRGFIDNGSPELFSEEENLIRFFIWYGDESLTEDFDEYTDELELSSFEDPEALVNLFSTAMEAVDQYPERFPLLVDRVDEIYAAVLKRIVRFENTVLFPTEENAADTRVTLTLSLALMEYGDLRDNSLAEDIGAGMGVDVMGEMDENGFLPSSFVIEEGEVVPGREDLAPEKVYPLLTSNKFYPHLVSLSDELDYNVRLWTVAESVEADMDGDELSISLAFAEGETQYVAIRGIPSFSRFEIYGMRWGSDSRFQTYRVGGWSYDRDTRTLYAKIQHKDRVESLVMNGVEG